MLEALSLARLPTPLTRLDRLSGDVGVEIWVKRDDLTGFGLSGNKVRKLDLLLGEAIDEGADTVITCGGLQSNHCRAVAVAARQLGLTPHLLLRGVAPAVADGNLLLDHLLGAAITLCTPDEYRSARGALMQQIADHVRARGGRPYVIPEGGSNGLGALGLARAASEVAEEAEPFDAVFVAVGSGGTLAGLALGEDIGPLRGVAVCDDRQTFVDIVERIGREAEERGSLPMPPVGERWEVLEAYRGPAYGVATPEVWATIRRVAEREGLLLDPVYTGKAFHGMLEEIRSGRARGRVLFWHTGGAFGLFGRGDEALVGR
jgi:D-cysteine desulfhydrase